MNEDEHNYSTSAKQQKLTDTMSQDSDQQHLLEEPIQPHFNLKYRFNAIPIPSVSVADHSNLASTPAIFRLTIDCFDEIFDYFNLQDLCLKGHEILPNY